MVRIGDDATRGDHRCASYGSYASAVLFFFSFVFFASGFAIENESRSFQHAHMREYEALNSSIIYNLWQGRQKSQAGYLAGELSASLAWVTLLPAVGALGHVAGGNDGRSAVRFMTSCFQGAAMISIIDFTFQAGLHSTTDWMSTWPAMQPDFGKPLIEAVVEDATKVAEAAMVGNMACRGSCTAGVCDNFPADADKPECEGACTECHDNHSLEHHDHDGDGVADHDHWDHGEEGAAAAVDWHPHDGGFGALQALELDYQVPPLTHGDTHCRLGRHG